MTYLYKLRDTYYYNRRIPEDYREFDSRGTIRISLKTDSRSLAQKKAVILNQQVEEYWQGLMAANSSHESKKFRQVVRTVRQLGFAYRPMSDIVQLPIEQIIERILAVKDGTPKQIEAVLGAREEEELRLSHGWEKFLRYTKDRVINKSPQQLRKWTNPRKKAVNNLIAVAGDKAVTSYTRDDLMLLKDWWIARIEKKGMNPASANKDLMHLKSVFECLSDNLSLGLKIDTLFKKIVFKSKNKKSRLPFTSEQVIEILNSPKLNRMKPKHKWVIWALAETGMRPTEVAGLLPEDIQLDAEIPHVRIVARAERNLKTDHSEREIPLVGYSLRAFKVMPEGIPEFRFNPDDLTTSINKFMRENSLFPSKKHSLYSFRHSFQDRILSVDAPDRVQADLMGHRLGRPEYGDGSSLTQKKDWLLKAQLELNCLHE